MIKWVDFQMREKTTICHTFVLVKRQAWSQLMLSFVFFSLVDFNYSGTKSEIKRSKLEVVLLAFALSSFSTAEKIEKMLAWWIVLFGVTSFQHFCKKLVAGFVKDTPDRCLNAHVNKTSGTYPTLNQFVYVPKPNTEYFCWERWIQPTSAVSFLHEANVNEVLHMARFVITSTFLVSHVPLGPSTPSCCATGYQSHLSSLPLPA